ncbi:MAG: choice-of-anchor Q domain-containing protein [Rhodanobacteraceae bacterium]
MRAAAALANKSPPRPDGGATIPVTNCDDDGVGSLRDAVQNIAVSGDTVSMAGLACSTITLTSGAIITAADDLTIVGPGTNLYSVTIEANYTSEIFIHLGAGTLQLEYMTVLNGGKYTMDDANAPGGCVYSSGQVALLDTGVKYCKAEAQGTGQALGGGVYAKVGVTALSSTISGNTARGTSSRSSGGGVFTEGPVFAKYSWFRDNTASVANFGFYGYGGAIWNAGDATILNSTISGNFAGVVAGADFLGFTATQDLEVGNTTVTDNYAYNSSFGGGLYFGTPAVVSNSTITGNEARNPANVKYGGGITIGDVATLSIQSSIVSTNTIYDGSAHLPDDIGVFGGGLLSGGANNLVGYSTQELPPDTIITLDPGLGELSSLNGGPTPTMAPLTGSPAINNGNNVNNGKYDQRGPGYPRTVGANTDIGAVESDTLFANGFD